MLKINADCMDIPFALKYHMLRWAGALIFLSWDLIWALVEYNNNACSIKFLL